MKNENNEKLGPREQRRRFTEEQNKELERRMAKEKEMEQTRNELKELIFNDEKKANTYKREIPKKEINLEKKEVNVKVPKGVTFILILLLLLVLAFSGYLIYDAPNQISYVQQIINAIFIALIALFFVISYHRCYKKRKSTLTVFTALLTAGLLSFNALVSVNVLELPKQNSVPDFSNTSLTKAITWAEANNINYEQTFDYSDQINRYNVVSQDVKAETLTKNVDKIDFAVSNGPDYNKEVLIADMTDWNIDDSVDVIKENMLKNVTVNFEENFDVDRDTIISQSKSGKIKRSDDVTITVSLGDKTLLKPITLKDVKNMSLFDVTLYLNRNAIEYELKYEFSNKVAKGNVINCDTKQGTKLSPGDKVVLTISKGKEIKVPELRNMKLSEVTKWMIENNLNINYSDAYDNKIKSGNVISSNYKKGDIIEEETTVDIVVSKGKLKMPKLSDIDTFKAWADKNGVKYEIKEEFNNDVAKDDIIKASVKTGKTINLDETITVYVSKGKAVTVPNFIGKNKSAIQNECDKLNIKCSFAYEYSTSKENNTAIKQSKNEGEQIPEGDTIQITLATNDRNKVTSTSSSNSSSSSSSSSRPSSSNNSNTNTSTGNSSNNNNNNNTNQCTSATYNINIRALNNIFNNYSGYNTVKSQLEMYFQKNFPGLTVRVTGDSSAESSPGSFVSGFKGGNVSCPSTVNIIIAQ